MTIDTFYEKFVPNHKMDTKGVVEYISKLESELYEKNREIEIKNKRIEELEEYEFMYKGLEE